MINFIGYCIIPYESACCALEGATLQLGKRIQYGWRCLQKLISYKTRSLVQNIFSIIARKDATFVWNVPESTKKSIQPVEPPIWSFWR